MDRATLPLRLHVILNFYSGICLESLSVHDVRPIFPLLHGFDGRLRQNRIAPNDYKIRNIPLPIDCGLKNHISGDVVHPGVPGIYRVHFVTKQTVRHS